MREEPQVHPGGTASPVAVFILGILGVTALSVLAGIPAVILGSRTLAAMDEGRYPADNKSLVQAGVMLGFVSLVLFAILVIVVGLYYAMPGSPPRAQ
jgi:hypothetical protein